MADDTAPYSLADLEYYISTCPVVDNHAHNLYRRHGLRTENLLSLTTEAADEALEDTRASLPHLRAAKQLLKLFDLPADADWRATIEKRFELLDQDADNLIRKCLEKTQTILIDDGFDDAEVIEPYDWHDQFTRSPCKRLIRIDEEASHILSLMHDEGQLPTGIDIADEDACYLAWAAFFTGFSIIIEEGLSSSSVAGFKSAICFSNGLNVSVGSDDGFHSFCKEHLPSCVKDDFAIQAKGMNDALVVQTCKLISAAHEQEMTPWKKLLWGTDGHWFPETFWLANLQVRQALKKVLGEYVGEGDLSVEEVMDVTRRILFENANEVYGLGLDFKNAMEESANDEGKEGKI